MSWLYICWNCELHNQQRTDWHWLMDEKGSSSSDVPSKVFVGFSKDATLSFSIIFFNDHRRNQCILQYLSEVLVRATWHWFCKALNFTGGMRIVSSEDIPSCGFRRMVSDWCSTGLGLGYYLQYIILMLIKSVSAPLCLVDRWQHFYPVSPWVSLFTLICYLSRYIWTK